MEATISSVVLYSFIGRAITSVINKPTKSFVFLNVAKGVIYAFRLVSPYLSIK